jgi:hypothetical protein
MTLPPIRSQHEPSTSPSAQSGSALKSLGKFARQHVKLLRQLGWHQFVKCLQIPFDTTDDLASIPHPAAPYLRTLATHGVPAPSHSPPWTKQQLQTVLNRGAHVSAKRLYREFLFEDILDMVQKGYWTVLPFSAVQHLTHLKLSPAGVVPQRSRRPRPIMDYSFTGVNPQSLPISPTHAMQLGHTLPRLLQSIAYADPTHGPPLLMKLDLADGYYRVRLTPQAALELAVVLPGPGNSSYVGIPLCLPMGWTHSPPYFCAFTETATDLANHALLSNHPWTTTAHTLEEASQAAALPIMQSFSPTIVHPPTMHSQPPLGLVDVYIDDFIGVAQQPVQQAVLRVMFHAISRIFRHDRHPDDNPN